MIIIIVLELDELLKLVINLKNQRFEDIIVTYL